MIDRQSSLEMIYMASMRETFKLKVRQLWDELESREYGDRMQEWNEWRQRPNMQAGSRPLRRIFGSAIQVPIAPEMPWLRSVIEPNPGASMEERRRYSESIRGR